MKTLLLRIVLSAGLTISGFLAMSGAHAVSVTGMDFVGGCNGCGNGGNADTASVAAILGLDEDLVDYLGEVAVTDGDNWNIGDADVTHLAWKGAEYFILGKLTDDEGTWSMDILDWSPAFDTVLCPAAICGSERFYEIGDFLNGGDQIPDLSNVRAFSVVPVPAAAWLFGSALGVIGWLRRLRVR